MVTTLIPTPTTPPSVSPRAAAPASHAAAAFAMSTTASSFVETNRWLGGGDAFGCDSNEGMYGTKRIHPGRLGGMT